MIAIEDVDKSIKKDIIVEGLMRSKGVYLLVSQPKVGKSMFALQLAYSLTNGLPFLGNKTIASPVIYITTESDVYQINQRMEYMNLKAKKQSLFLIDRANKEKISMSDIEVDLCEHSDPNKTKFLIIDMLKDFDFGIAYEMNDFQDISQKLLPKIRNLADKYNYTILLTHHLNKRKETLGSTGFNACVDGVFTLIEKNNKLNVQLSTINRDFPSIQLLLKKDSKLVFIVCDEDDEEIVDPNLIMFIKFASIKGEFELSSTDIVRQANLFCTPVTFGKLINSKIDALKKEGLHITKVRSSNKRNYLVRYEEPLIDN